MIFGLSKSVLDSSELQSAVGVASVFSWLICVTEVHAFKKTNM
jgi:hypothetical protein